MEDWLLKNERLSANKNAEFCELTSMVMIQDDKGNVLVQEQQKSKWIYVANRSY